MAGVRDLAIHARTFGQNPNESRETISSGPKRTEEAFITSVIFFFVPGLSCAPMDEAFHHALLAEVPITPAGVGNGVAKLISR